MSITITITINDIDFEIDFENFIAKVKEIRCEGDIVVPRSVIYESNEYIIKSILPNCLNMNNKAISLRFSEDSEVEFIEEYAFSKSTIKSITLPPKLSTIQPNTFQFSKLKTINFTPYSKLKYIKESALSSLGELETITLPSTVEVLEEGFCSFTPSLTNFIFLPENKNILILEKKIIVGKLIPNSDTFDLLLFAPRNMKKVTIPSFIKKIGDHAFNGCEFLESVEFEENKEGLIIGKWSFAFTRIKKIFFPSFITSIGDSSFYRCENLDEVKFADDSKINSLPNDAFLNSIIREVVIPKNIEKVNMLAFKYCDQLYLIEILAEKIEFINSPEGFDYDVAILMCSCPNAKTVNFHTTSFEVCFLKANCSIIIEAHK